MGKLVLLVAGAAFAALPVSSSAGAPVTVEFSGTVTLVQDEGILDGSVQVGTPFSGSFTYDSGAIDLDSDPAVGAYLFTRPPAALRLEVGNYVFEEPTAAPDLSSIVWDNDPRSGLDGFGIAGGQPISVSGPLDPFSEGVLEQFTSVAFGVTSPLPGPLTSDALPTSPPVLADWATRTIAISASTLGAPAPFLVIRGNVTAIVPEPATASLLLASVAGLAGLARWRARRQ